MKTLEYVPVPAFEDNYIWVISDGQDAVLSIRAKPRLLKPI